MKAEEFVKSNKFKMLLPIAIVAMIIALWKEGYQFGQWLYDLLHK